MKATADIYKPSHLRMTITETFPELISLKKANNKEDFNNLTLKILSSLKKYVQERLATLSNHPHFSRNKYSADDIIDQLFVEVYDNIEEVQKADDFYLWLFKKTDKLLEDITVDEEFDNFFNKNIDDFTKDERNEMEEQFSTDGDGDLLMLEELDDISYNKNDYTLNHVFIEDNEQQYIDQLDRKLDDNKIQKHIATVLKQLPAPIQSTFSLFANYNFTPTEIANLKQITTVSAIHLIQTARISIRDSFIKNYLNPNKP
ncbi:sigma-70 family RNA polymerase sigma factor [Mangrovimonas sp. YM274]|uniref:sigma-70 family RNA polymerase sigma factor n=1 Tax=Mangrovimonas sp. YM274 TaxID=3070660 RepID=UPI0027DB48F5|nr:sigma-70 family RNA polymerase sigma factor [Mangrovimonas sp. YM274]WMI69530.1 sigma-70 family RNA polymerase sigma factor [Mangrovimonas sp. YM274]